MGYIIVFILGAACGVTGLIAFVAKRNGLW